jgi:hypothetical protein
VIAWLLVATAWAQEESCGGILSVEELREALDATEEALADLQVDRADRILDDVVDILRCVGSPLTPDDLGRLARHVALVAFYDADQAELRSWTWLERDTVGGGWPVAELPVPGTFHTLRADLSEPPLVVADGGWSPPKGGAVLIDGRPSVGPEARSEVPHLLQMLDKKGRVVWSGWMLGADAPERWLDPSGGPIDVPRWVDEPAPPAPWDDGPIDASPSEGEPVAVDGPPTVEDVDPEDDAPIPDADDGSDAEEGREGRKPRRTTDFMEIFPECPWRQGPNKVSAEGTTVQVNRFSYDARSGDDVEALAKVFRQCGEFRAARRLARWSEARRKLFAGGEAKTQRDAMVRVLLADEPRRGE